MVEICKKFMHGFYTFTVMAASLHRKSRIALKQY